MPVAWRTDEPQARTEATTKHMPALLFFNASWSVADKELDEKTFTSPEVRKELSRFITIRIDVTNDEAPAAIAATRKYRPVGVPTLIVFDSGGIEVSRWIQ